MFAWRVLQKPDPRPPILCFVRYRRQPWPSISPVLVGNFTSLLIVRTRRFHSRMSVITPQESSLELSNLLPRWHRKAPESLVANCRLDDPLSGWKVWQDYLRTRNKPRLPRAFTKKKSPLLWGWPGEWDRSTLKEAIRAPGTLAENIISEDESRPELPVALQCVALAYTLPALVDELPAEIWWQLLDRLIGTATQAQTARLDWPGEPRNIVRQQLLAGELPLALCYLFPELESTRSLRDDARGALSEALLELTDGQGLPDARLLPVLGPLFACWTRSRWLGSRMKRGPWSRDAETQYRWLVRQAIRLADKSGRFVLTANDSDDAWNRKLFRRALLLAADRGDLAAAKHALPRRVTRGFKISESRLPEASLNSDWSGITIMSTGWSKSDVRLSVSYAANPMRIEVSANGKRLLCGQWQTETWCNAQPVEATGNWEQLCYESGKRSEFLELGLRLSDGLRIERQIVFGREDRVIYLADVVASSDNVPRDIRHAIHFPLAPGAEWRAEAETRDGLIVNGKTSAAVLPLGLREWRNDPRGGTLTESVQEIVLDQQANGRAMCCSLFIDLDRERTHYERTWRQLTVGENLEIVPADAAVGYRAQSGDDQWLIYRSLGPVGNRTVLGQNISGEFPAGRFARGEKYREWVETESFRGSGLVLSEP